MDSEQKFNNIDPFASIKKIVADSDQPKNNIENLPPEVSELMKKITSNTEQPTPNINNLPPEASELMKNILSSESQLNTNQKNNFPKSPTVSSSGLNNQIKPPPPPDFSQNQIANSPNNTQNNNTYNQIKSFLKEDVPAPKSVELNMDEKSIPLNSILRRTNPSVSLNNIMNAAPSVQTDSARKLYTNHLLRKTNPELNINSQEVNNFVNYNSSPKASPVNKPPGPLPPLPPPPPPPPSDSQAVSTKSYIVNEFGSIFGIQIGKTTKKEVIEIMKAKSNINNLNITDETLKYNDIGINFHFAIGNLDEISFYYPFEGQTSKGLKIGDNIKKAIEIYGYPNIKTGSGAIWGKISLFLNDDIVTTIRLKV